MVRRAMGIAAVLTLTSTAGALTACSTEPPEPDSALVDVDRELVALNETDSAGGSPIFTEQAEAVDKEVLRLCGTDNEGEPPEECTTHTDVGFEGEPSVSGVRESMMTLIGADGDADYEGAPGDDGVRDRAGLLTGLHAALATIDERGGSPAIDQELLDGGFSDSGDTAQALEPVAELVHQAVYLSGVVLPEAGGDRGTVVTVGTRMRSIRDAVEPVSGVAAAPGYSDTGSTDDSSAAGTLLPAVHAVTVELRRAVDSVAAEDRAVTAMWAAVSARSEAALEDALGEDPLAVSIRGE